jgi:hypothetical protein
MMPYYLHVIFGGVLMMLELVVRKICYEDLKWLREEPSDGLSL